MQWLSELDWTSSTPILVAQTTLGPNECVCRLAHHILPPCEAKQFETSMRASKDHTTFRGAIRALVTQLNSRDSILFIEQIGGGAVTSVELLRPDAPLPRALTSEEAQHAFKKTPNVATVIVDATFSQMVKYVPPNVTTNRVDKNTTTTALLDRARQTIVR